MDKSEAIEMLKHLWNHSVNKSRRTTRTTSTPKSDNAVLVTEIDLCYSTEYNNWKVKTFWGTKKAYTYPIKPYRVNQYIEFMETISTMEDEEFSRSI